MAWQASTPLARSRPAFRTNVKLCRLAGMIPVESPMLYLPAIAAEIGILALGSRDAASRRHQQR
jgi:hypothetical protein